MKADFINILSLLVSVPILICAFITLIEGETVPGEIYFCIVLADFIGVLDNCLLRHMLYVDENNEEKKEDDKN